MRAQGRLSKAHDAEVFLLGEEKPRRAPVSSRRGVLTRLSIDVNSGRAPTSASSLGERGTLRRTSITISHCPKASRWRLSERRESIANATSARLFAGIEPWLRELEQ
jgi:hypothetical protein